MPRLAHGGVLTAADFARHKANWVAPIYVQYRGRTAYNFPPNTQGMASLKILNILNILNNFDVKSLGESSADCYHLMVEAPKQAFADRDRYLSDLSSSRFQSSSCCPLPTAPIRRREST